MDLFALQLAIIFLPGLIWAKMDMKFANKVDLRLTELLLNAFMFGVTSYLLVYVIYTLVGVQFDTVTLADAKAQNRSALDHKLVDEILVASFFSFLMAIFWLMGCKYKVLTRCLRRIDATDTYGDQDLWDRIFNSPGPEYAFVNIRDHEKDLTYTGFVDAFSQTNERRELVLREVLVYRTSDASLLEQIPRFYFSREPSDISIEFPYVGEGE